MTETKQVSINKNKCLPININDLDPSHLDIKKSSKDIYIYYIQENFNSSSPLRIKINSATGYFQKKKNNKIKMMKNIQFLI